MTDVVAYRKLDVGSSFRVVRAQQTRPANTTPYTAGDAVSGASAAYMTFSDILENEPVTDRTGCLIPKVRVTMSEKKSTTMYLALFSGDFTAVADNAPFDVDDTDALLNVANVDLPLVYRNVGSNSNVVYESNLIMPEHVVLTSKNLYGQLVITTAYTPSSASVFTVDIITIPSE